MRRTVNPFGGRPASRAGRPARRGVLVLLGFALVVAAAVFAYLWRAAASDEAELRRALRAEQLARYEERDRASTRVQRLEEAALYARLVRPSGRPARTVAVTQHIWALGRDGDTLAALETGELCEARPVLTSLATRRRLPFLVCPDIKGGGFAVAGRRVAWQTLVTPCGNQECGTTMSVAGPTRRNGREVASWSELTDIADPPLPALLDGRGAAFVYVRFEGVGGTYGSVWVVRGTSTRLLFQYEYASLIAFDGRFVALLGGPSIEVRTLTGRRVLTRGLTGRPLAADLEGGSLAVLTREGARRRITVYRIGAQSAAVTVGVPTTTSDVAVDRRSVVFAAGRRLFARRLSTRRVRLVATTRGLPFGLALEAGTVTWAENVGGRGYIRALDLDLR